MKVSAHPMQRTQQLASVLLLVLATAYLGWMLHGQWDSATAALHLVKMHWLAAALLPAMAMYLAKSYYHAMILRQLAPPLSDRLGAMRAYCEAQVVRYLPGKVWGLVFQGARMSRAVNLSTVLAGNLIQTLYTTGGTVGLCAIATLVLLTGQPLWWGLLLPGLAVFALLHRAAVLERWSLALLNRLPIEQAQVMVASTDRNTFQTIRLLGLDWLLFWAAWALFTTGLMPPAEAVMLSLCYCAAAVVASLAVVTPAGLVVREALFVIIGQRAGYSVEQLLLLGVLARVLFMLAELLVIPVLAAIQRSFHDPSHAN